MNLIGVHRFGAGSPPFFHALINFPSKRERERVSRGTSPGEQYISPAILSSVSLINFMNSQQHVVDLFSRHVGLVVVVVFG